ncbi:hypothetical protein BV25DRAFT_1820980 [Artomyces pyxidatus]|uniref:Uncharacterized protein n=1 Tax=Artomyces pyxidatus TaxID=48021 RepID=A0ACB8TCT7_9AGAM|nr:hypothetical protein BV25DRAFT_1820980 [Artomyces pyxidatus]
MGILDSLANLSPRSFSKSPVPQIKAELVRPAEAAPPTATEPVQPSSASHTTDAPSTAASTPKSPRWSFQRPLTFFNPPHDPHKPALSLAQDQSKRALAAHAALAPKLKLSSSADRRAKQSALVVRALIVGPAGAGSTTRAGPGEKATKPSAVSKDEVSRVKTQLLAPKAANRLIAQLRTLPATGAASDAPQLPIHAVCLPYTEEEATEKHFKLLQSEAATETLGVATATLSSITAALADMHIVSLLAAPNFGLGAPASEPGILAGAVPSAATVIEGIEQVTPQLMALGYATGRAVFPDHSGVYPPTDRMSVLTYWWGLELVIPPPSLAYLSKADSTAHTLINVLTAIASVNDGVREILPFVRYISQFVDFEFSQIRAQDQGKGVVCAATWIMPAAMVPRPWDFPNPPPATSTPAPPAAPISAPDASPNPITPNPISTPASPPAASPTPASPPVFEAPIPTPPVAPSTGPGQAPLLSPITLFPGPGSSVAIASGA